MQLLKSYRPKLYTTPDLSPEDSGYFQSLIEIIRWGVVIGHIDITF